MPKRIITDIVQAHAVALCRRGANPGAHVLLRKTADNPSPSSSEEPEMSIKSILAFNALSDVAKAHVTALAETDPAAADAFLTKTADEQKAELEKAGKKPDDEKKPAAEAKKTGAAAGGEGGEGGENVNKGVITAEELQKSITAAVTAAVTPLTEQITALKADKVESDLRKTAEGRDFVGYPGGADKVFEALKAVEGQPEAVRTVVIDSLKSQAAVGRAATQFQGLHLVADGDGTTNGEIQKKVAELRKADPKLSEEDAMKAALADDALLMKALDEEAA